MTDPVARGRSSARMGKDQERRAERRYGWEKVGELGGKADLVGRLAKVQQRSTRRRAPAMWREAFAGLDAIPDGRVPLLLLSFVRQGVPVEDYVVVRGSDWLELHGRDEPARPVTDVSTRFLDRLTDEEWAAFEEAIG